VKYNSNRDELPPVFILL